MECWGQTGSKREEHASMGEMGVKGESQPRGRGSKGHVAAYHRTAPLKERVRERRAGYMVNARREHKVLKD